MNIDIRACSSAEELRSALAPMWHYFSLAPADEVVQHFARLMTPERALTARDGTEVVGGAGAFPFQLTVPGGRVRAAGVSIVGVMPTHRRRGVMTQMIGRILEDCRNRAEPVAYLWATDDRLYGRFGFGLASLAAEIDLPRERSTFARSVETRARADILALPDAEARLAPVYERVASATPGMFRREAEWWQARTLASPNARRQNQGLQCAAFEIGGRPAGYALYRFNPVWERGVVTGTAEVVEAMGDSPGATAAVWRYLLDLDGAARIVARLMPLDHPLLHLLAEPRRLRMNLRDGTFVRLIDLGAALQARRFEPGDPVVVEVADSLCPWNAGSWRIGAGAVERTGAAADLACDIAALGSVYLGGFTWSALARALGVEERKEGALRRADRLFRTDRLPWCAEIF
jgi:predicted acetyltransferase